MSLNEKLDQYRNEKGITTKGSLAVILVVTRKAKTSGLPLDPSSLRADSTGQVSGLGKTSVQAILSEYNITKVLAAEGGRTSRGSLKKMEEYVAFLNQLHKEGIDDLDAIELWWIERVKEYFSSKPFVLRFDTGMSINSVVKDLIEQAEKRQKENPGTMYAGAVLQHLVGAKLEIVVKEQEIIHHGSSVADAPTGRTGDFIVGNTIIHVTTAPSESLMEKCIANINSGYRPFIVTVNNKVTAALQLADIKGIAKRVEIIDAEQFISTNVYEWSSFDSTRQKEMIERFLDKYNELIDAYETDPSLKVNFN
jgi:hypothetical protein